ncbi:MAG: hypothetical protein IKP57_03260 [Paludibacteraceae bacterium]|nr:hypothetical protein [Paludibacteraceae bacterium]
MKKFFMAVIALMMTANASARFYIYLSNGEVLQADSISTVAPPAEFSVGESKKVQFAHGNLQYQASTQTWRFAENQYDTIGGANSNISDSYSGWIDLFGWGTGNNPINTSMNTGDYPTFNDWGDNIGEGWRTLNTDEWIYLFCERTDAAHLFGMGSVNGVNGTIVLPDDWAGDKFTDTDNGLNYSDGSYGNNDGERYSFNTYTAEQWRTMEEAGAVFLPAPGCRAGTEVINVNLAGYYWSSTPSNLGGEAYYLYISSYGLNPHYSNGRHNAISVRLVRDF